MCTAEVEVFSSYGKFGKGGGIIFKDRETTLIENFEGPGLVSYLQFTADFPGYRETRFRIYYDNLPEPSVDSMLYHHMTQSCEGFFGTSAKGSFFLTVPIPFESSIRITASVHEDAPVEDGQLVYWTVRGSTGLPASIGGFTLPEDARLSIIEADEVVLHPLEEFEAVPGMASGHGLYLGMQLDMESTGLDFMEGPVIATTKKGDDSITHFLGISLDDYLTSAWWMSESSKTYCVNGLAALNRLTAMGHLNAHRLHTKDLLIWHDYFRLTLSNGDRSDSGELMGEPKCTHAKGLQSTRWLAGHCRRQGRTAK